VSHRNHNCTDVKIAGEEFRESLINDINKQSACVLENQNEVKQLEMRKNRFLADVARAERKISRQTEKLVSLIQLQQSDLVYKLNFFKDEKLNQMEADKKESEKKLAMHGSFKTSGQEMVDKGSACDLSHSANEFEAKMKKLMMTQKVVNDSSRVDITFTSNIAFTQSITTSCDAKNAVGVLSFQGLSISFALQVSFRLQF